MTLIKLFSHQEHKGSIRYRCELYGATSRKVSYTDDISIWQVEFDVFPAGIVKIVDCEGGSEFHPYRANTSFSTCGWRIVLEAIAELRIASNQRQTSDTSADLTDPVFGRQTIQGKSLTRWKADDQTHYQDHEFPGKMSICQAWKENPATPHERFEYQCVASGADIKSGTVGGHLRAAHQVAKKLYELNLLTPELRADLRSIAGCFSWDVAPGFSETLSVPWWFEPGYLAPEGWLEDLELAQSRIALLKDFGPDWTYEGRIYRDEDGRIFRARYSSGAAGHPGYTSRVTLLPFEAIT